MQSFHVIFKSFQRAVSKCFRIHAGMRCIYFHIFKNIFLGNILHFHEFARHDLETLHIETNIKKC